MKKDKKEIAKKEVSKKETVKETKEAAKVKDTEKVKDSNTKNQAKISKKGKVKSSYAAKKGLFSALIIVIVCVVLVAVNVLAILIAQKIPTTIDVTATNSFKLSENNIEYIKQFNDVDNISKIEIILCATKAGYTGTEMVNYVKNNYNIDETASPDNYFNQTVRLVEEYPKYCSKIQVSYIDPQEPSFEKLESETDVEIAYGDILIRATKTDGTTKSTLLNLLDLYEVQLIEDANYYYMGIESYQITISKVENSVSGALNRIAMGVSKSLAVVTRNCNTANIEPLLNSLKNYDYSLSYLNGTLNYESLKEFDAVLISAPTNDIDNETLKVIDKFLENDGKLGKSLIYIASQSSPATPNLNLFLNDWGFKATDGILYETDNTNYYPSQPTTIYLESTDDDYALDFESTEKLFVSGSNTPFEITFPNATKGSRTVHTLLQSSETTLIAPKGTTGEYTAPSSTVKKAYPAILMSMDIRYDDDDNEVMSSVIAFSSESLVSSTWTQYTDVGNIDFSTQMINTSLGRENSLYIMPKGTTITGITSPINEATFIILIVALLILLPILILAGGIAFWIIRLTRS